MYSAKDVAKVLRSLKEIPPARDYRGANQSWEHPPLVLTKPLLFGDQDVQHILNYYLGPRFYVDDLINVFEEMVDTFYGSKIEPLNRSRDFMVRELQLDKTYTSWLFPQGSQTHHHIAVLLWMIGNQGGQLSYGPDHVTVTVDGIEVGMREGKVISVYEVNRVDVPTEDWQKFFEEPRAKTWCSERAFNDLRTLFSDDEAAQVVLQLVKATNKSLTKFIYYVYGHQKENPTRHQIKLYERFCGRLQDAVDPYSSIKAFLVPRYFSKDAFAMKFGQPYHYVDDEDNDGTGKLLDKFYRETGFITKRREHPSC